MKRKPIRIYLDSSDYINLYKSNISSQYQVVRDFILKELDLGRIEVGISFPVIFEVLQKYKEEFKFDRIERAKFIKRLCNGKAFPHFKDVLNGKYFPNDGIFVPLDAVKVLSAATFKANFKSVLSEAAIERKDTLSRHMRRKISSVKSVRKLAKLAITKNLVREDFGSIPVTDEFIAGKFTEKFLTGEISSRAFEVEFRKWIFDPVAFCSFWYEYADLENPILKIEHDHYEKILQNIEKMRSMKEIFEESALKINAAKRKINEIRRSGILPESFFEFDSIKLPSIPKKLDLEFDFSQYFGPKRSEPFSSYASWAVEKNVPIQRSDLGDLMHLFYLEDVDIMRCDRRMSAIMTERKICGYQKIESSLFNLPNRIRLLIDKSNV